MSCVTRPLVLSLGLIAAAIVAAPAQAQPQWPVNPTAITVIPPVSPTGEVQLERPVGATRLSNGTIVVGDARRSTLAYFDRTGREITRAGRQGAGPGEFNGLWWIGQCGRDTVYAWDRANARLTIVDATGKFVRDTPPPLPPADAGRTAYATCSRGGQFAFVSLPTSMDPQLPVQRAPAALSVVTLGEDPLKIGEGIASSEFVVRRGGGVPRPLGFTTTIAVGRDRIYVGTGDSAAVLLFDATGKALGSIAVPAARSNPLKAGQYERAIDDLLIEVPSAAAETIRGMLADLPRPQRLPHYGALFADPSGTLWVVQSAPGDPTRLIAVDPSGRTIGQLQLPQPVQVLEVGDDYVLAQQRNDDGEPFIAAYGFQRSPGSR